MDREYWTEFVLTSPSDAQCDAAQRVAKAHDGRVTDAATTLRLSFPDYEEDAARKHLRAAKVRFREERVRHAERIRHP